VAAMASFALNLRQDNKTTRQNNIASSGYEASQLTYSLKILFSKNQKQKLR
jgi:hypothetical protein